jgi:hypothetical protein
MSNFKIVSDNLCNLSLQKQTGKPSISSPPIAIETADLKDLEDGFYTIDVKFMVSKYFEECEDTLLLNFRFAPLVHIDSEEDPEPIMKKLVPRRLFDNVRVLVWHLTSEANLPLMLDNEDWNFFKEYNSTENNHQKGEHQCGSVSDGHKNALKEIVTAFKDLPSYEYYYRFITPIEYKHPDFEECDEEVWSVLYQLLFGSFVMDCYLDERIDGLLDLCFYDADSHSGSVSNLTSYELDVLILHLWTAMGNDLLPLMEEENLNQEIEIQFEEGDLISKEDFFSPYQLDESDLDNNLNETLEKMYDKIVKCDAESFPYRC